MHSTICLYTEDCVVQFFIPFSLSLHSLLFPPYPGFVWHIGICHSCKYICTLFIFSYYYYYRVMNPFIDMGGKDHVTRSANHIHDIKIQKYSWSIKKHILFCFSSLTLTLLKEKAPSTSFPEYTIYNQSTKIWVLDLISRYQITQLQASRETSNTWQWSSPFKVDCFLFIPFPEGSMLVFIYLFGFDFLPAEPLTIIIIIFW